MNRPTPLSDKSCLPSWVHFLAQAGHSAPSADNSQPWRFIWNERSMSLVYDSACEASGLGRHHPAVQMAFGAVIENMVQAGLAAGMKVESWDFRYLSHVDGPFLVIPAPIEVSNNAQTPQEWIFNRHTNRKKYLLNPLPDETVLELNNLSEGNAKIRVYNEPKNIQKLSKFVRRASEIRFQTEEVHRWLALNLRFTANEVNQGDGLDVETLALPPGGRQLLKFIADWRWMKALNRLGAYKLLSFVEGVQFEQCGGIVIIKGADDNDQARWIAAGRLMERAWLLLNCKNLSVQPYFVLPDLFYRLRTNCVPVSLREKANETATSTSEFLELQDQSLFMIMRVGKAKFIPKRSKRLPLDTVLLYQEIDL